MDEQRREAAAEATEALVEVLAEKLAPLIAGEVSREVSAAVAEKVEEISGLRVSGEEVMRASEAAEFLRMSRHAFNRIAPELPRCRVSANRYVYLRKDLISWLEAKREAPTWWWREGGDQPPEKGKRQRVQRLV